jgi:DNA-binding MarR family transcriptional regulator
MSRPTRQQLVDWRVFLESAFALIDILDAERQSERKITLAWYDALVHLEDATDGVGMTELANQILASKSGPTRVIDRMKAGGLVRRERPPEDMAPQGEGCCCALPSALAGGGDRPG